MGSELILGWWRTTQRGSPRAPKAPKRHRRSPEWRRGARQNGARSDEGSRGGEEYASGPAVELPSAEFARGRVVANCHPTGGGRRHRHEGSQRPVHAAWHRLWGLGSTHVLTCGAPQPSAAQRVATFPRCAVQQQRRRRPQLVRPGAPSPHDPRTHARRDSGVLRLRGCRAPASLVAMLAARGKPTEAHLLLERK